MTPLERAAGALRAEIAYEHGAGEFIVEGGIRENEFFRDAVRAVLTAIREQSEAMLSDRVIRQHGYAGDIEMVWRAMIDAALAEGN